MTSYSSAPIAPRMRDAATVAGTEQAAGTHVPLLKIHTSLNDCLSELQLARPSLRKIALDNINPAASLCSALAKDPPVTDGRPQTV